MISPDLVLINPGSRKRVYQSLAAELAAIEPPVWTGLMATYAARKGCAVEVIDAEAIQQNARRVGGHLKSGLLELQERHPLIGEVRGLGLMLGVELVRNRQSKEPATSEAADVLELCRERGLLLGKGGLYGNVLRIKPPMCLSIDDADFLVDCLDEVMTLLGDHSSATARE